MGLSNRCHKVDSQKPALNGTFPSFTGFTMGKGKAAHPSALAWRTPGTAAPGGQQSLGSQGVGHVGATALSFMRRLERESESIYHRLREPVYGPAPHRLKAPNAEAGSRPPAGHTHLGFKELPPQLGICGRHRPPQVPVPSPDHVSAPGRLDPRVQGAVSPGPRETLAAQPRSAPGRPAPSRPGRPGPAAHLVAHLILKSRAPSRITRVWYWFFLQRGHVFLFVNFSKA